MPDPSVLYVIGQLGVGGAEQQLYYLLDALRPHAAVVSCSSGGAWEEPIRQLGYRVVGLERHRHWEPRRLRAVTRLMRALRPDIVHVFLDGVSGLYGRLGGMLAGHPRVVVSERLHPTEYPAWLRTLTPLLNLHTAALVCNSRTARDWIAQHGLISARKLHLIPNGVDLSRFDQPSGDGYWPLLDGWRDHPIIGTVGRLVPRKRPDAFLQVAAMTHQHYPGARFVLVGDGPLRHRLVETARTLGLKDVVHFAGERRDVPRLLRAFDIFVTTTRNEGMANVVLEAMASARPCVVTNAGDNADLVGDGEAGYVVPVGDVQRTVSRVSELLAGPALRSAMGRRARARVERDFSLTALAERHDALYRSLMTADTARLLEIPSE